MNKSGTFGTAVGAIFLALLIAFGLSIVLAIPVWLLWNWLMPMIFGVTKITLIQAWGIALLSNILFKSTATSNS